MLRSRTRCEVEIVTVDTRNEFPQILSSFDLIHVDGDHSTIGAASDILNAAPLASRGGVIIVDDIDNPAVELGVSIALAALGPRAVRRNAGEFHRQALIFMRHRVPQIPLSVAASLYGADAATMLDFRRERLRDLGSGGAVPDPGVVADLFGSIMEGYAKRFGVQPPASDGASDVFSGFTALAQAMPGGDQILELAKPHVRYAAERLRGVEPPPVYGPCPKAADSFEPGSPPYRRMVWEVACNLAEILAQTARDRQKAA